MTWAEYLESLRRKADAKLQEWEEGTYSDEEYIVLKRVEYALKMYQAAAMHCAAIHPGKDEHVDPGYMGADAG